MGAAVSFEVMQRRVELSEDDKLFMRRVFARTSYEKVVEKFCDNDNEPLPYDEAFSEGTSPGAMNSILDGEGSLLRIATVERLPENGRASGRKVAFVLPR